MIALVKSNNRFEQMMVELEKILEDEIKQILIDEFSPHLKNRWVVFEESMGGITFEVTLRDDRILCIAQSFYWIHRGDDDPLETKSLDKFLWVKKAQNLIKEYQQLSCKTKTKVNIRVFVCRI